MHIALSVVIRFEDTEKKLQEVIMEHFMHLGNLDVYHENVLLTNL